MGHRHLFTQSLEMGTDQNRNHLHAEQPSSHPGRAGVVGNASFVFPMDNISTGGVHYASHWNPSVRSNEYSSLTLSTGVPHYRVVTSGPVYDPFLHPQAGGSVYPIQQNYGQCMSSYSSSSSSDYHRPPIHGAQPTIDTGRGPYKRKSPTFPLLDERGTPRRYYSAGSSSNASVSMDLQREEHKSFSQYRPWDTFGMSPTSRGTSLSIGAVGSQRNVSSCSTLDLGGTLARTRFSSNPPQHTHSTGCSIDHSDMWVLPGLHANATSREFNPISSSPATRARILASGNSSLGFETNRILFGGSSTNGYPNIGAHNHFPLPSRNSIVPLQNLHGPYAEAVREGRSSNSRRARPPYRATSSNPPLGFVANPLHDGLLPLSDSHSSRHSRLLSTVGWRTSDRNGRSRLISDERFTSLSDADTTDRLISEDLLTIERSTLYGSRNLIDQHRDMRLDVDNMSYEELLALGERIGNVNTGLCEDLVSECMTQTLYYSPDHIEDEETCVICLEEYKNKEEIAELNKCSHNFHVGCIKKWLSMKNVCPICKVPPLEDGLKDE